ncbi:MAG: hypothetical protein ABI843_13255 [Dokdonella sp.]
MSRWHAYALASITPQFSWAVLPPAYGPPQVLDNYTGALAAQPGMFKLQNAAATRFNISIATGNIADTPNVMPNQVAHLIDRPQSGLQRTVVAPSLARDWGERGTLRLTGVFAYQRFASLGMGTGAGQWSPTPSWWSDSSYGVGARFDVGSAFGNRFSWNLGYQSRVGMGVFANYRGVFADRGDFDIPASANAGLGYALTPNFDVDVGVQRVQYSAITPFTSSTLPTRFLALLGDGSSPIFRWRDLNVYSVGWTLHGDGLGSVQLRYTTRQQPLPTSRLLEDALAPATANDMISLGWSRAFTANTSLSLAASYATSPYYLLMPTYTQRENGTASQFEFEALWSVRF